MVVAKLEVGWREEDITEACDCSEATLEVDDEGLPIIRNVKILGSISMNRRFYTRQAKEGAVHLYEGAKVYINHPDNPHKTRDFRDRIGKIINPRMVGDDLYGDLIYNPHHRDAKDVVWWAKHDPSGLGLSHNAVGQGEDDENGIFRVHRIASVRSVDLVAEPATTKTLFESAMPETTNPPAATQTPPAATPPAPQVVETVSLQESFEWKLGKECLTIKKNPDLSEDQKRVRLLTAFGLIRDSDINPEPKGATVPKTLTEAVEALKASEDPNVKMLLEAVSKTPPAPAAPVEAEKKPEDEAKKKQLLEARQLVESFVQKKTTDMKKLEQQASQYKNKETFQKNRKVATRLCLEAKLPKELMTEVFLNRLSRASDEKQMKLLIEDRSQLASLSSGTPKVSKTAPKPKVTDMKIEDFARSFNRGR